MQGLGKGIPMLILTLLRVLVISLAFSIIFVFYLNKGLEWVWIAQVISVVVSSIIAWLWMKNIFKKIYFKIKK